jgi:hypothetical protein
MNKDKYKLLLIGDFSYFLNDRYFMQSTQIIWGILALISQSLHYWKYYKNESPSYLKPFEMISGLVSPKSIGLMDREDINQLLNKSKLMFKVSKSLTMGLSIGSFFVSLIPLIINSSFELYLIEIFWSLLIAACNYFASNIILSHMTYFYIICLYLKLKLRNANNSITKNFEEKYKITNYRMKNILISLNSIILEINTYNSDLWSKYLMIVLMLVIIVFDILFFQSIFGKMSFFFKMIFFYASCLEFLLLIILINTASTVSFEANKSYKLLNKLFITHNKQVSIRMRIKVRI